MKFIDLTTQYRSIKKEVDRAIFKVINRSDFIMGQEVKMLEEKIAKFCHTKYAVSLNSGTDALYVALKALKIGKGDEVIVPAFTYLATAETVVLNGARPVFVDIDPKTFNIDVNEIESAITKKTRAIIPVHLYGLMAEMNEILRIAKKHKLKIIEDAAQAIGAEYYGKKAGSMGDVGCLSFFPTKNLGAYGDGGMLLTNNKKIAYYAAKWRIHGQYKKYYSAFIGDSSRLDTIQAAILLVKLKYLNQWTNGRIKVAKLYNSIFNNSAFKTPFVPKNTKHVFHQYSVLSKNRNNLITKCKKIGLPFMVYYPQPLHLQKSMRYLKYKKNDFPITEKISKSVISFPIDYKKNNKIVTLLKKII